MSKKHVFNNNLFLLLQLPLDNLCANDLVNLMMFIIKNAYVKTFTL